jgi:hypothetical protein
VRHEGVAIVQASHKDASRSGYVTLFKDIYNSLVQLRSSNMSKLASAATADTPPDFSKLISDAAMQGILQKRWTECVICMSYGAPLAAAVMVGGLLEGWITVAAKVWAWFCVTTATIFTHRKNCRTVFR